MFWLIVWCGLLLLTTGLSHKPLVVQIIFQLFLTGRLAGGLTHPPACMITLRKPRRAKRIKNLLPDKAKVTRSGPSKLEARFSLLWQGLQGPELESEFRFHPIRKWRADFVHHGSKTLIEVEGGIWGRGRHNTGAGMAADMEKYLEATLAGYRVIRLCDKQLNLETVARVVGYCNAGVATPPATPAPVVW